MALEDFIWHDLIYEPFDKIEENTKSDKPSFDYGCEIVDDMAVMHFTDGTKIYIDKTDWALYNEEIINMPYDELLREYAIEVIK